MIITVSIINRVCIVYFVYSVKPVYMVKLDIRKFVKFVKNLIILAKYYKNLEF